jgi:hypothetical protein
VHFNGVKLLNGALSSTVTAKTNEADAASATGGITITSNPEAGASGSITLNGVAVTIVDSTTTATAGQVQGGGSVAQTVQNLSNFLNNAGGNTSLTASQRNALSQASYSVTGNTLNITAKNGGSLGSSYTIGDFSNTIGGFTTTGGATPNRSASISGITVATSATTLTTSNSTIRSGALTFNGASIATVTAGTSSLDSIAAEINSNTGATGLTASITGSTGAYSLNVKTANTAVTVGFAATGALAATSTASATYSVGSPVQSKPSVTQTLSFAGVASITANATNAGSGAVTGGLRVGGVISFNGANYTVAAADTLTTVASGLQAAIRAKNVLAGNADTTSTVVATAGTNSTLLVTDKGSLGVGAGIASATTSTALATTPFGVSVTSAATAGAQTIRLNASSAASSVTGNGLLTAGSTNLTFNGIALTQTVTGGQSITAFASALQASIRAANGGPDTTSTVTVTDNGNGTVDLAIAVAAGTVGSTTTPFAGLSGAGLGTVASVVTNNTVANATASNTTTVIDNIGVASGAGVPFGSTGFAAGQLSVDGASITLAGTETLNQIAINLQTAIRASNVGDTTSTVTITAGTTAGTSKLTVVNQGNNSGVGVAAATTTNARANELGSTVTPTYSAATATTLNTPTGFSVSKNGQYADASAAITGITVSTTGTALTTANSTIQSGALTFNGTSIATVTAGTTTLDSLVADINSRSSTSGLSAYVTGSSGSYNLNVKTNNTSVTTGFATTGALSSTVASTATYGITAPVQAKQAVSQTLTFAGISTISGNSGLSAGTITYNGASYTATLNESLTSVATGLQTAIRNKNFLATGNVDTTSTVSATASTNSTLAISDKGTAGVGSGLGVSTALGSNYKVGLGVVSNPTVSTAAQSVNFIGLASAATSVTSAGNFTAGQTITGFNGLTFGTAVTVTGGDTLATVAANIQTQLAAISAGSTVTTAATGNGFGLTVNSTTAGSNSNGLTFGSGFSSVTGAVTNTTAQSTTSVIDNIGSSPFATGGLTAGALTVDGASITLAGTETLSAIAAALQVAIRASNVADTTSTVTVTAGTTAGTSKLTVVNTGTGSGAGFASTGSLASASSTTLSRTYSAAAATTVNTVQALAGGKDNGIGYNSVSATGSIGNDVLVGQNQKSSSITITYPNISANDLNSVSNFGGSSPAAITVGGVAFKFTAQSSSSANEIQIGATLSETLDNAVAKINSFKGTGAQNFSFNQISASRSGNSIVLEGKGIGSVTDITGTALTASASGASVSTSGSFTNGSDTGINTSGIKNKDFVGSISGFTVSSTNTANVVNLSITVGSDTYSASNVSTNPSANSTITLSSADGGFFTIQQQALKGSNVSANSVSDASNYATRLNAAVGGLTFYQERELSGYKPTDGGTSGAIYTNGTSSGSLIGSKISIADSSFATDKKITDISVTSPQGTSSNGSISFSVDGSTYTNASPIGSFLAANTTYEFASTTDANKKISFTTGSQGVDFGSTAKAASFEKALGGALGVGNGSAAISFQVGSKSSETISVSLGEASSNSLFGGKKLDVKTQATAIEASTVLQTALDTITSLRATVGALQGRFNYASAAIQNAVQNQGAARSTLLDTDVASASTAFATSQVQLQAGIAILAQANQLQQNLLKLIP